MSIIKSKHADDYTIVPNEIFKHKLSIESIGLLTYFLSLPHDWVIHKSILHTQLNIGREKVDRMFKELQNTGYIISVKRKQTSGKWDYEHIVYDKPSTVQPSTVQPSTVQPSTANQQLLNTNIQNTNITKETKQNKKYKEFDFHTHLLSLGVRTQIAQDWLRVRKSKKASNTETAFALFLSEVQKSGLTPEECVLICVEHSWKGFKSAWVNNLGTKKESYEEITKTIRELNPDL